MKIIPPNEQQVIRDPMQAIGIVSQSFNQKLNALVDDVNIKIVALVSAMEAHDPKMAEKYNCLTLEVHSFSLHSGLEEARTKGHIAIMGKIKEQVAILEKEIANNESLKRAFRKGKKKAENAMQEEEKEAAKDDTSTEASE